MFQATAKLTKVWLGWQEDFEATACNLPIGFCDHM